MFVIVQSKTLSAVPLWLIWWFCLQIILCSYLILKKMN